MIIEEMAAAERFFIIHNGKIEITKRLEGYEDFVLSVQSDGDFFGEMALLDEGPRSASVRALEPTLVFEITREDFDTLLRKAPVLAFRIAKELIARLRESGALLISQHKQRNRLLLQAYIETISSILESIEPRRESAGIAHLVGAIGREMGMGDDELLVIELSALIRDLGSLTSAVMPTLDRILPKMLSHSSASAPGAGDHMADAALLRASRIVGLAEAYSSLETKGGPALEMLRSAPPGRFDAEAVDALARVVAGQAPAKDPD